MSEKIGRQIMVALKDCATFGAGGYVWKRKSMEKAVGLGLAREVPARHGYQGPAYVLTDAGYAALSSHQRLGE
jgi:hypothetical protein